MFIDVMDQGRLVRITGKTKDEQRYTCRVYFRDAKGKSPQFAGITEIPVSLFDHEVNVIDSRYNGNLRIGFVPAHMVLSQEETEETVA